MRLSRREFLPTAGLGLGALWSRSGARASVVAARRARAFDPWLEIDEGALRANASAVARMAGGRPVLAVVKNNAYGLGLTTIAPVLNALEEIAGCAVVKSEAALALRDAGFAGPVLLMARVDDAEAEELVRRGIQLTPFAADDLQRLPALAERLRRPVPVQLYVDTGMARLGIPFRRAADWTAALVSTGAVVVEGSFTAFTEEDEFDAVQLARFREVVETARRAGVDPGPLHAASSHGVVFRRDAHLDMVRPGLVLFGAHPAGTPEDVGAQLRPAFRLKAKVVRVERLEPGDSVSYGREYVAERPTWIATLPVGHADGYPRRAVEGCEVLIAGRLYPVIGAVSASHTIVELGDEASVVVEDEAVLIGPDHAAIHPNAVAERAGISVYDVLMHLGAGLPRQLV